jgi:hypothetical protein
VVAEAPGDALTDMCRRTGGILITVSDPAGLEPALLNLYSALSNRYCVRYRPPSPSSPATRIEVRCGQGRAECMIPA